MPAGPIFLVRHGETEWNAQGRFQGQLDSPLTLRGRAEARLVGHILSAHLGADPDLPLHVSPLGRARETASLLRTYFSCAEPVQDERLQEVSLGSWDGLDKVEIDAEWPNALDGASPFNWYFRSPDGESYEAASARLGSWLDEQQGPSSPSRTALPAGSFAAHILVLSPGKLSASRSLRTLSSSSPTA